MFTGNYWNSSASKLKSTKYLALIASMIALKTITSAIYIPISENLHIGITFVIVAVESMIIGPAAGMVSGCITDLVSFMMLPSGPFFFGYTLSSILGSLVYGLFFYRRKIRIYHIIGAKGFVNYIVNVLIGSLWSSILYSKGYYYYFMKSLVKNTLMLPIEVLLLFFVFKAVIPYLAKKNFISEN